MLQKFVSLSVLAIAFAAHGSIAAAETNQDAQAASCVAKPGLAALCVYRGATESQAEVAVEIDGQALGKVAAKTYLPADLAPGRHALAAKSEGTDAIELDTVPGHAYFIRQNGQGARVKLMLVDENEGKKEISQARAAAVAQSFFPSQAALKKREAALAARASANGASGAPKTFEPIDPMAAKAAPVSNVYEPVDPSTKKADSKLVAEPRRIGQSSVTVEKLARGQDCGDVPAYLASKNGPREEYEVFCKDSRVMRARCDFHQCRMVQ
jgi:hypothetical protein